MDMQRANDFDLNLCITVATNNNSLIITDFMNKYTQRFSENVRNAHNISQSKVMYYKDCFLSE